MNSILSSSWYNHRHSAPVLRNCNKSTVHDPFLAPFLLILDLFLEIHRAPFLPLGRGLTFLSAFDRLGSDPSLTHSSDKYALHGPSNYRNYKTVVGVLLYTSTTNDNYLSFSFLLFDRLHTIARVPHLTLPVPLISMALGPLLPSSLRILDNGPCRGLGLCILCTTPPLSPLAMVPYLASSSVFLGRDSIVARGFVELPAPDPISVFHATSSPFPMLWSG